MIWVLILGALSLIAVTVTLWARREFDIRDTLNRARKVESDLERGIAVFKPESKKEEKNFIILTMRGIMKKNLLGGYSFRESQDFFNARVNRESGKLKGDNL